MTARLKRRPGPLWASLFMSVVTLVVYVGWNIDINRPFELPSFYDTRVWLLGGLALTFWFNFASSHLYYATYTTLSTRVTALHLIFGTCYAFYEAPMIIKSLILNAAGCIAVLLVLMTRDSYTDFTFIILLYLELVFSKPCMDILVQLSHFHSLTPRPSIVDSEDSSERPSPDAVYFPVSGPLCLHPQEHIRNACIVDTRADDYRVDYGAGVAGHGKSETVVVSAARVAAVVYPAAFSFWKHQLQQFAFVFDGKYFVYSHIERRASRAIESAYRQRFYIGGAP